MGDVLTQLSFTTLVAFLVFNWKSSLSDYFCVGILLLCGPYIDLQMLTVSTNRSPTRKFWQLHRLTIDEQDQSGRVGCNQLYSYCSSYDCRGYCWKAFIDQQE